MPRYIVELLDVGEKKKLEKALKKAKESNDKILKSRFTSFYCKVVGKSLGVDLTPDMCVKFEYKWISDTKVEVYLGSALPIKETHFDKQIESLKKKLPVKIQKIGT